MLLRPAKASDAAAIAQIQATAWSAANDGIVPRIYLQSLFDASRTAIWQDRIKQREPEIWLVEVDSSTVGWISFGAARGAQADPSTGEIWAIHVDPARWSHGIGSALLDKALPRLTDLGYASCLRWVLEANERARALYSRAGFFQTSDAPEAVVIANATLSKLRHLRRLGPVDS